MTEKVKITQEQADAIEFLSEHHEVNTALDLHANGDSWTGVEWSPLNGLSQGELARALYNGYEIEPEPLEVGDWATTECGRAGKITRINGNQAWACWGSDDEKRWNSLDILRKMTPEEKERQLWSKIGREVGEFKERDTGFDFDGRIVPGFTALNETYANGKLQGFYPAESFINFEEVEEE